MHPLMTRIQAEPLEQRRSCLHNLPSLSEASGSSVGPDQTPLQSFSSSPQSTTELGKQGPAALPDLQCGWLLSSGCGGDVDSGGAGWNSSPSLWCLLLQHQAKHDGDLQHLFHRDSRPRPGRRHLHLPSYPHLPGGAAESQHAGFT